MKTISFSQIQRTAQDLIRLGNQSNHNRIITVGFLGISVFAPFWIYDIIYGTIHGAASLLLVALAGFGFYQLWQKRDELKTLEPTEEDRWLGYALIFAAIAAIPFCFSAEWRQKLDLYMILIGMAISCWGIQFFPKYPLQTFLIFVGFFPQPTTVGHESHEWYQRHDHPCCG